MYISGSIPHIPHGITCITGSGGKTSLIKYLSLTLSGTVIVTTTTHMYPFSGMPLIDAGKINDCRPELILNEVLQQELERNRVVCFGSLLPSGKLSSPSDMLRPEELIPLADYILIEADGSRQLPLKAHRPNEPVIPAGTSLTIGVNGASGIGKPLCEVCHCPELFASIAGIDINTPVQIEHIASVVNYEDTSDCYYINQTDLLPDLADAVKLCELINRKAYAGSLKFKTENRPLPY